MKLLENLLIIFSMKVAQLIQYLTNNNLITTQNKTKSSILILYLLQGILIFNLQIKIFFNTPKLISPNHLIAINLDYHIILRYQNFNQKIKHHQLLKAIGTLINFMY